MKVIGLTGAPDRPSLDRVLEKVNRHGGPSLHGWHMFDPMFRCWRKFALGRMIGEDIGSRGTSPAKAVGSLIHELLADYYSLMTLSESILKAAAESGYEKEVDEAKRLFSAYREYYEAQGDFLVVGNVLGTSVKKIVAIEAAYERKLPWRVPYSCRADMVVERSDGFWAVDHKTTSRRDVVYTDGWQLDPQMFGIAWILSKKFKPFRGVIINGIVKTKKVGFDRLSFVISDRMIDSWLATMRYRRKEEKRAGKANWPASFTSCIGRFGKCRYFSLCASGWRPGDELTLEKALGPEPEVAAVDERDLVDAF